MSDVDVIRAFSSAVGFTFPSSSNNAVLCKYPMLIITYQNEPITINQINKTKSLNEEAVATKQKSPIWNTL